MTYFLTGATGYIGECLALRLVNDGHNVHALIRSKDRARNLVHPKIKLFEGDIQNIQSLEEAIEGCDYVFHLAAYARVWSKDKDLPYKINVKGTTNVLEVALKCKIRRVVFTSTGGTLEPSSSSRQTDENTLRTVPFFNDYEITKAEAENVALGFVGKGLDVVIVNPTRVYGPGLISESNAMTRIIRQFNAGKWRIIPGDGSKIGNYVFVDDVVEGHLMAMEKGQVGQRYIIGGENISYDDFFKKLRLITGKTQVLFHIPFLLMFIGGSIQFAIARLTGLSPLITPRWIRKYLHNWSVSVSKAETELGYRVTTLDQGLRKTVDWLMQNSKK